MYMSHPSLTVRYIYVTQLEQVVDMWAERVLHW
jgi:hypothetical protein